MWRQQENHKLGTVQLKAGRDGGEHRASSFILKMITQIKFCRSWGYVGSMLQKPEEPQLGSLSLQSVWISDGRKNQWQGKCPGHTFPSDC